MDGAKIQLSAEEMRLVRDPAWILTKNSIMRKVVELMAGLSEACRPLWEHAFPPGGHGGPYTTSPKIAKGENYKGLPYVILDYPRIFGREDVLAIRTLFWWGNYFSVTLHLKGRYKELFLPAIREHIPMLGAAGFHIGVSDDEWRHELAKDNYCALEDISPGDLDAILTGHAFLKFSAQVPLGTGAGIGDGLLRLYDTVVRAVNFPAGEKDPSPGSSTIGSGP